MVENLENEEWLEKQKSVIDRNVEKLIKNEKALREQRRKDFECEALTDYMLDKGIEMVDHPKHYNHGKYEVIDVIEDWELGFSLGNSIKYIARAKHKANELEDLRKAKWYLEHEIERLEKEHESRN